VIRYGFAPKDRSTLTREGRYASLPYVNERSRKRAARPTTKEERRLTIDTAFRQVAGEAVAGLYASLLEEAHAVQRPEAPARPSAMPTSASDSVPEDANPSCELCLSFVDTDSASDHTPLDEAYDVEEGAMLVHRLREAPRARALRRGSIETHYQTPKPPRQRRRPRSL